MATAYGFNSCNVSPRTMSTTPEAKQVTFVLHEARIPLRVSIYPHDATESIITTVKNFYGLYYNERAGISFEDERGNTMIARYENFVDHQSVHVRIIDNPRGLSPSYNHADDDESNHYTPRTTLRTSRIRSHSPHGTRGRRSDSTAIAGKKKRSRSFKTMHGDHGDGVNGYSSGDDASGSVSGKNKEPIGNTDISVENIVEGGRRKRAKLFESSELPLFAPPQMPAATSNHSFSPIRHNDSHRPPLPFSNATQNPFSNPRPLQTPPNYHNHYAASSTYATPAIDDRRSRGSIGYDASVAATGKRTMLTPDPTVRSCVSEEDKDIQDVAMQLMLLQGDWKNHGRSSGSTLDDTFSGRADVSCSTGTTSDCESESEDEMPLAHTKTDGFGNQSVFQTTESHFAVPQDGAEVSGDDADYEDGDGVEQGTMAAPKLLKNPKPRSGSLNGSRARSQSTSKPKPIKATKPKTKKTSANPVLMTPASMPASRKQSVVSTSAYSAPHGEEEQPDLSTKPRCQRCRKSKKGCDRQRPCGRCKDAGIPAEQCISEDEGNGRKGRYGRHMGVPVSVNKEEASAPATLLPAALIAPAGVLGSVPNSSALDKSRKRKR
ncbi:hypothetical protein SMACR_03943 [Sordaria macrospora]|uniref:WGS project CABT00000000 data, contig 2.17 n=2 Tax=Sordaria macrospora TaxID=5147 RepID=F7W0D8_SORMK|nr:uncharacterized protein SMAC_03943 [Sordaria macrospora k-hell]KAA8634989.1 hypothetical protein SMACR_03943 [Sordaria macrospora]WPJ60320.1 hypothetical protein SMAC4_03943 [Sordaria macrospora]CCC11238.1 unnamed protein product [Sordaria macrospora k-hell]